MRNIKQHRDTRFRKFFNQSGRKTKTKTKNIPIRERERGQLTPCQGWRCQETIHEGPRVGD